MCHNENSFKLIIYYKLIFFRFIFFFDKQRDETENVSIRKRKRRKTVGRESENGSRKSSDGTTEGFAVCTTEENERSVSVIRRRIKELQRIGGKMGERIRIFCVDRCVASIRLFTANVVYSASIIRRRADLDGIVLVKIRMRFH